MDENGVKLGIKNIWQKRPGALRNPQSLLVWDMFRSKKLLTESNTDIAVIPGGISISNSLDGTEDDYLFMEESNSDGENDTDFDDMPEDIMEDEYADLFMLYNNGSS
ncbi:hypothetical protein TNCV_4331071 [Trichonephila clavipes]|nr:hypothetical protein TNCV_4331071 [Trichonephila clavipes]